MFVLAKEDTVRLLSFTAGYVVSFPSLALQSREASSETPLVVCSTWEAKVTNSCCCAMVCFSVLLTCVCLLRSVGRMKWALPMHCNLDPYKCFPSHFCSWTTKQLFFTSCPVCISLHLKFISYLSQWKKFLFYEKKFLLKQFNFRQKNEISGKLGVDRKYLIFHCCYSQSKIDFKVPALLLLKNFCQYVSSVCCLPYFPSFPAFGKSCGKMGSVLLTGDTLRPCISVTGVFFFCKELAT